MSNVVDFPRKVGAPPGFGMPYGKAANSEPEPQTMSSKEIADKTGKAHMHVMRDIRTMLEDIPEGASKFGSIYLDAYQREQKCFKLPQRELDILLTGYSTLMRPKVIDR